MLRQFSIKSWENTINPDWFFRKQKQYSGFFLNAAVCIWHSECEVIFKVWTYFPTLKIHCRLRISISSWHVNMHSYQLKVTSSGRPSFSAPATISGFFPCVLTAFTLLRLFEHWHVTLIVLRQTPVYWSLLRAGILIRSSFPTPSMMPGT